MISRTAPDPLSMQTTPRLFERLFREPFVAVCIDRGGTRPQIKLESKTVIVLSPRSPGFEYPDLQGDSLKEALR